MIQLRDANGNAVSQAGVSVTVTASGGTLGGTASATTNASGVATFSGLSISGLAGGYTPHLPFDRTHIGDVREHRPVGRCRRHDRHERR